MTTPATYIFESEAHQIHAYEIGEDGLSYQAPGQPVVTVRWKDIKYLEDISGKRVDIVRNDAATPIPVFYGTRQFSTLLTTVCAQLAALHDRQIGTQTFRGSKAYFIHLGVVLGVLAVLFLGSIVYLYQYTFVWLFMVTVTAPMIVYIILQPHTVTPYDDGLSIQDFRKTRVIAYDHIQEVCFDFHGDRQLSFLCILIHLANGRKIKIQRFENLILLLIFILNKWYAAQRANPDRTLQTYPAGDVGIDG